MALNSELIHEWKFVKSCGEQTIYLQKKEKIFKFLEGQSKVGKSFPELGCAMSKRINQAKVDRSLKNQCDLGSKIS